MAAQCINDGHKFHWSWSNDSEVSNKNEPRARLLTPVKILI